MSKQRSDDATQRQMLEQFARSVMSRRSVIGGMAAGAAALPLAGSFPTPARARAALSAGAIAAAQRALLQTDGDSAEAAVAAANALDEKPESISIVWEDGLQSIEPTEFSGPMWEELTGIRVEVVSRPFPDLFASQVAEHLAATGGFDALSVVPSWMGDFLSQGMVEPLGAYVAQYMNPADLDDYHPLYKGFMEYGGETYSLFDDGDMILLYHRTDLFEDQANKDAFQAQYGYELAPPTDWTQYDEIQAFFTGQGAPDLYGGASQRAAGQVYGWYSEEFRNRGGRFFDEATMDATLDSEAGIETLTRMVESNKTMPPGIETWGFVEVLTAWLAGDLAMVGGAWPPYGRWSQGTSAEQLAWVPETQIAGKIGYSVMPMGHSLHNAGFALSVSSQSRNKEATYLFLQWLTSPTISLQRVMLPYTLRDPYRLSHFASEEYRSQWNNAADYLDTLSLAADSALLDLVLPGSAEYHTALDQMVTAAQAGTDPAQAAADGNAAFNAITDRIGRESQTTAYAEFVKLKGSYYE